MGTRRISARTDHALEEIAKVMASSCDIMVDR
ncbi:MAG: hypothetical protein US98_C0031G0009, partial [Parcubacteria group bacterium GW2011_GWC1_38_6]